MEDLTPGAFGPWGFFFEPTTAREGKGDRK